MFLLPLMFPLPLLPCHRVDIQAVVEARKEEEVARTVVFPLVPDMAGIDAAEVPFESVAENIEAPGEPLGFVATLVQVASAEMASALAATLVGIAGIHLG